MVTFDTVIVTYRLCHSYKQIKLAVNAVSLSCMPITIFSFISSSLSLCIVVIICPSESLRPEQLCSQNAFALLNTAVHVIRIIHTTLMSRSHTNAVSP